MKRRQILVAEDDASIRTGLVDALEGEGYAVVTAREGETALKLYRQGGFDLVLLDIMMPLLSGYDLCREIRKSDQRTPIILLTAKGEEIDKVVGLELGADDYVTKPFGVRELLARIAAALRRAAPECDSATVRDPFPFGPGVVDPLKHQLLIGDQVLSLTPRELKMLICFHQHPDEALSRDYLLNQAWGIDYLGTTRTLDQHIVQLRKKIETEPAHPEWILTVHGHGYRYHPTVGST